MATRKGSNRNDVLTGSGATDVLFGLAGNDRLDGGARNDKLDGGAGNDRLFGGSGNDILIGGAGNDTLDGGAGRDSLRGDAGDDLYVIDSAKEISATLADAGVDTVKSSVSYQLGIHQEHLTLSGGAALNGTGNEKANTLTGNGGANRLDGRGGADRLFGGSGNDVLVFDALDLAQDGGAGQDTLLFAGAGLALTSAHLQRAAGIEVLDLRGSGGNTLRFDAARIPTLSDTDVLRIRAGTDDEVMSHGAWTAGADIDIGGVNYAQFSLGSAVLQVESTAPRLIGGSLPLVNLTGANGFRILGIANYDYSGIAVSTAGDVNGDGFDDFLIGASGADPGGKDRAGSSFVVFGRADGFPATFALDALDGSNGFRLNGSAAEERSGRAVSSAGDINSDGFDDLLIGAYRADVGSTDTGSTYVVFGRASGFTSTLNLNTLNGGSGFRLDGAAAGDYSGRAVSGAGDVNGDGFDDLLIGAYSADFGGVYSGSTYVLFGRASGFAATTSLSSVNGTNGFRLDGVAAGERSGRAIASAGDVNGDGLEDLVIGAYASAANGSASGASYVVFGRADGFAASVGLSALDGRNGFRLVGATSGDNSGVAVSGAGDFDGDGLADVLIGAYHAGDAGASYVVFGRATGFPATLNLASLDGTDGFRLVGGAPGELSGLAVSAAGDINSDGLDDLLVGSASGAAYVVFGQANGMPASLSLSALDGTNGMRLQGLSSTDPTGRAVSAAGDINADGFDDVLLGAPGGAGAGLVVLGRDFTGAVTRQGGVGNDVLAGTTAAESVVGGLGDDMLDGAGGRDVLRGGGGNDVLFWRAGALALDGGSGSDILRLASGGVALLAGESAVRRIETLDLTGGGANTAMLDPLGVRAVTEGPHRLTVLGDSGDLLNLVGAWTAPGGAAPGFTRYQAGAVTLFVDNDVEVLRGGVLSLAALDGGTGFRLDGASANERAGRAMSSAGDMNGDGLDDLLIGAYRSGANGYGSGASYVVFGQANAGAAAVSLSALNGANGFRIVGAAPRDYSGQAVSSAGDVNGDGFDDVLVGAQGADPNGLFSGSSYVIFGRSNGFAATVNLNGLTSTDGFRLDGPANEDYSGAKVSAAGDVNGDGFDDVMISARGVDTGTLGGGSTYVVFGRPDGFAAALNLSTLNGANGFRLNGVAGSLSGYAIHAAGDINGDGIDDLLIGANGDSHNATGAGSTYVVFGSTSGLPAVIDLSDIDGINGFRLDGDFTNGHSGDAVSGAGDVNGDGFDDLIIGAFQVPENGSLSGASYVVFGHAGSFAPAFNLGALDGTNGFRLTGATAYDYAGRSVSAAGDVNGDGFDDLLVGAHRADANGLDAGATYLVFGRGGGFAANLDLGALQGVSGLQLVGPATSNSGRAVSAAGDVNGDGYDDLLVGTNTPSPNGASYVVFGRDFTGDADLVGGAGNDSLVGTTSAESLLGGLGDDLLDGRRGADVLRGGGGNDTLTWYEDSTRVDGGSGLDSVRVVGAGVTLDLGLLPNSRLTGIERIDLTGQGDNSLSLTLRDVLALPDHSGMFLDTRGREILVDGNAGDLVISTGQGWLAGANVTLDGQTYAAYTSALAAATLLVDLDITRTVS